MPNMLINIASRQLAVVHRCFSATGQYYDNILISSLACHGFNVCRIDLKFSSIASNTITVMNFYFKNVFKIYKMKVVYPVKNLKKMNSVYDINRYMNYYIIHQPIGTTETFIY